MIDEYTASSAVHMENYPTAELIVSIDGENKTIHFKPLVEDQLPGNIQKIISEIKRLTQELQ